MEIFKIKKNTIDILFDGKHYTFSDTFKGVFAVATRMKSTEDVELFNLMFGNSHNYSECDWQTDCKIAEDFINKQENKHIPKLVCFESSKCKCDQTYFLTIGINKY